VSGKFLLFVSQLLSIVPGSEGNQMIQSKEVEAHSSLHVVE
jgi:hypothetical protein